ncbi:MAG: PHP domain-containing protein [Candidatus Eisenbacteria bacterium]|uniref:PHP domain-containing protein n=1 Tax=Eiseniibacteriota bacterium TaxID=2212470 RepID=A0A849SQT4_UNCEI|nr:PHP domain-containing protein [Candidatus Eisenbacteria bacterium]
MKPRPPRMTGGRRVDLHAHTFFSDGLLSPEALVERARERRLAALAVTDHDTLEAIPRARVAAGTSLELVPGIELSAHADGTDLHILGYYLDPSHPRLRERLERFQDERRERAVGILRRLEALGLPLDPDDVFDTAGPGVVGRPHVAGAMLRAGHVTSIDEAFQRYLGPHGSAYVQRPSFRPEEAIDLVHESDGVSVLAHPGSALADPVIERLVARGLRGIEIWHPAHGVATVRRYRALARRFRLVETGGSDFHGHARGTDLGSQGVPTAVLDALKQAAGVTG